MKLTTLIMILAIVQVSANSFAQRITISKKNAELVDVFNQIKRQSGYDFVFNSLALKDAKKVNIQVKDAEIAEVLKEIFANQPLQYKINDNKLVVVTRKETSLVDKVINYFSAIDVSGKVVDEQGLPLPGASVKIKGSSKAAVTDKAGEFFLKGVTDDAVLFIAYLGYKPIELKVAPSMGVIRLELSSADLQEVTVSTGFWTSSKELSTSNIGKVDAKTIEKQPVMNVLSAIQGRIPGVSIQQTSGIQGSDVNIEIRGRNSLRRDGNTPLYVVDGVPFSVEKTSSSYNSSGILGNGTSPLAGINTADIESIEILKDADATAIYGSRGANGVIRITTKKGGTGKASGSLDAYTGYAFARQLKMMNTEQYLAVRKEAFANDGLTPSTDPTSVAYAPDLTIYDQNRYTNWQEDLVGNAARSSSMQASVTGGSDRTSFLIGAGYRHEGNVFPGDFGFDKGSLHFTGGYRSLDGKFSVSGSFSGALDHNAQTYIDITNRSRALAPNAPALYNFDGSINYANGSWENPLQALSRTFDSKVLTQISSVNIGYNILKDLKFQTTAGFTSVGSRERGLFPSTFYYPIQPSSVSSVIASTGSNQTWVAEPQLSYERKLWKGKLSALIGSSFQGQRLERVATSYRNFPSNSLIGSLSAASEVKPVEYLSPQYRYMALFARLNYNWADKYILNLTGRRDGSSRFAPERQFGNFGAAGAAWLFYKENWVTKNLPFLSFGKLRGSYGVTGSDQIGDYQYLDTYSSGTGTVPISYQEVTGLAPARLFNSVFGWETNRKLEAALELGFLGDRLNLSVAWYRNRSSNQLINYTLPLTTGFNGILSNFPATVENSGYEFELTTENIKRKALSWTTSFNFSLPRNVLRSFPGIENSTYANTYSVGSSIYNQYVFAYTGVDSQTGLYTFRDFNGDGLVNDLGDQKESVFVGQHFFGGLNNTLNYKGMQLDVFFEFVSQTGYNYAGNSPPLGWASNYPAFLADGDIWHKPGDVATVQRIATENNQAAFNAYLTYDRSSATIGTATYARLKNLALSYTLPKAWTGKTRLRLYFQGQNLLVITNFDSVDPESQFIRVAPLKVFTAGLQLQL